MKSLAISVIALIVITFSASATDPNVAIPAKESNLSEVMSNINYPLVSRENGVEGRVVVLVKINQDGGVTSNEVITSPCKNLSGAVEKAIMNLKFSPAKNQLGENIASSLRIPIDFKLTVD